MNSEPKNPNATSEHEKKNEGGREFGHVHEPTQAQQASKNQGQAGNQPQSGQQQKTGTQQSGAGSHQGTGSQQGKPPGNMTKEQPKERQGEKGERKSA
ncbi:MAG: hypothetical protein WA634_15245 [Silvibacterium sp.]